MFSSFLHCDVPFCRFPSLSLGFLFLLLAFCCVLILLILVPTWLDSGRSRREVRSLAACAFRAQFEEREEVACGLGGLYTGITTEE